MNFKNCLRSLRTKKYKKYSNENISILCNNCVGAMVLHDFGMKFNTPTVNLFIYPQDYILLLKNMEKLAEWELEDISGNNKYPIGLLNKNIKIHFLHYNSFNEACLSWYRRVKRVNINNIVVILVERDGCGIEELVEFDKLPYKKIALTYRKYPEIKSAYYIGRTCKNEPIQLTDFEGILGKRFYDRFNWEKFLFNI